MQGNLAKARCLRIAPPHKWDGNENTGKIHCRWLQPTDNKRELLGIKLRAINYQQRQNIFFILT
jgi:hypothetical protein